MRKFITLTSFIISSACSYAAYNVDFVSGLFANADGSAVSDTYSFAVIADVNKTDFSGFELANGDSFTAGSFINSSNAQMTLATGQLKSPDGDGNYFAMSSGTSGWSFDNTTLGLTGGEQVALIVWNNKTNSVSDGDNYCFFTPSLVGGELSGGDAWVIPSATEGSFYWNMYTISGEGVIVNSFGKLDKVVGVIPETSTIATAFGVIALAFAAYRRRK